MASRIDVTKISLGIGVLEFGYYDTNNVFQGYQDVGTIKGTWSAQVTRETKEFEVGRPLQEVKAEVIRERLEMSFQMAEFTVTHLKLAFGTGTISSSVAPTFVDGTNIAPDGSLTTSVVAVTNANILKIGGNCSLDRLALRFTHVKSCIDTKRQIFEAFICRAVGDVTLPFQEEDWNLWQVQFRGIADTSRPAGAQLFQIIDEV